MCRAPTSIIHTKGVMGPDDWNEYQPCPEDCESRNADWHGNRVEMYMSRPNIQLQTRIRISLRNLVRMDLPGKPIRIHDPAFVDSHLPHSPFHLHPPPLQHRCIGFQVRNGDAVTDARGESGVDRTLEAHIECMKSTLSDTKTGESSIFLATDNSTLFHKANLWHPEYTWYHQMRALPEWKPTEGAYVHRYEKSVQQDLANILADGIMLGRCTLLFIGTTSSAVSHRFYNVLRGSMILGGGPVNTIEHCQGKDK